LKIPKLKILLFCSSFLFFACGPSSKYIQNKTYSHKEIAKLYIQDNRYTEALRELELAEKTDKCDPEIYNLFGLVYMAKKEYSKAEWYFKKALEINSDYAEAYNNLGSLKMLEGRYSEAVIYFKKALANPLYLHSYIAKTNLGWAYYKLHEKKKAINTLLEALKENFRYYRALVRLGLIYMDEGNLDMAEFYLKRAVKAERSAGEPRYYLAEVFFRKKDYKTAKALWKSVIELDPDSEWANLASERLFFLERITQKKE